MDQDKIKVIFNINYHTAYGEDLFVVGSISSFGKWDPKNGFPLNYLPNGDWCGSLQLPMTLGRVEYKYVIYNKFLNTVRWEEGENRLLEFHQLSPLEKEIINIEVWNYREVTIRMKHNCAPGQFLSICGEGNILGNWRSPLTMERVIRKDPKSEKMEEFWEKVIFIHGSVKKLKYRYVVTDFNNNQSVWEREPNRVADFVTLAVKSPFRKYEGTPNEKLCEEFSRKQNRFIKYDIEFKSTLSYNFISDKIIIGPYLQRVSEVDLLQKEGVKAVLNLQCREDIMMRSVDLEEMKATYNQNGIKMMNISLLDSDIQDIVDKGYDSAVLLNHLVTKYGRVYVHCTSGVWRAPHVVASYLVFFAGFSIDEAITFVKEKRHVANLRHDVLQKILKRRKTSPKEEIKYSLT